MRKHRINRRTVLAGATALGAAGAFPAPAVAQRETTGQAPIGGASLPALGEFVVRGANVLTMDPALGDLASGDVHVRDGAIIAVGPGLAAAGAESIEGRGMICMPGFIDTHWHLWTSNLRPIVRADDAERGYFPVTAKLGPHYTPQDSYRAVRLGLAEALSAGVTTVHNWAHNVRSPAHADAEVAAQRDMGVRGRFGYGTPQGLANEQPMDLVDLARLKRDLAGDPMISLGIASRNVGRDPNPLRGPVTMEMIKKEWGGARDLGVGITLHTSRESPVTLLNEANLLGPDLQLVHPLLTTAEERALLKQRNTSYSIAPVAARRPAGVIQLGELLEAAVRCSMSTDHSTTINRDNFVGMRILYALHQHRIGNRMKLTSRRLVELATMDGARDLGLADKTGSLTPGKRADLILVRTTDTTMSPVGDPFEALVGLGQPANVDTVVVDGRILRRGRKFVALDHAQVVKDAMQSAADLRARAGWA